MLSALQDTLKSPATLRVILFSVMPILASVPGVTIDPVTYLITIDPFTVWPWVVGGVFGSLAIFAVWGKK